MRIWFDFQSSCYEYFHKYWQSPLKYESRFHFQRNTLTKKGGELPHKYQKKLLIIVRIVRNGVLRMAVLFVKLCVHARVHGNSGKSIFWFCSVYWRLSHTVQLVLVYPCDRLKIYWQHCFKCEEKRRQLWCIEPLAKL